MNEFKKRNVVDEGEMENLKERYDRAIMRIGRASAHPAHQDRTRAGGQAADVILTGMRIQPVRGSKGESCE